MKLFSLTDKLPDRLPMTPPDEPKEPDLSGAQECACGRSDLAWEIDGTGEESTIAVHCVSCKHTGPRRDYATQAIDAWNE